ncbi:hypothetical protein QU481_02560 [Crenobacter sp. SG2303]|uniref:Uncharacterized protein n=1 Tax=Crenobacter oryzisoli TaxID=3056844 RepID=A0ABT7XJ16_9NEIS|nr:hypothetical protein [Crenobacter sp. SG2303]MDN0073776.1 hypothetical protein [Crenobacter sp. SG2303]
MSADPEPYCAALIGAHALLEILMDIKSIPVSALLFTPLRAARDRL